MLSCAKISLLMFLRRINPVQMCGQSKEKNLIDLPHDECHAQY